MSEGRNVELPFLQSQPTLQFAWDNTSLVLLKECPRKYYYAIICGYRPLRKAPPLYFGGMFHKALEVYDEARAKGTDHTEAQVLAVKKAMLSTMHVEPEKQEESFDPETGEVTLKTVPPRLVLWQSDDPNRSRETLIRSICWYTEHFRDDVLKTYVFPDGTPAIELSFRFDLPINTPDGDPYLYVGHIDKVAEMANQLWNVERKHTKRTLSSSYFSGYTPNGQVTGYSFAGKVVLHKPVSGTIVDATQVAVGFNRHARHMAMRNEEQLNEWLVNTIHWIKMAEHYAASDYWPMNEESCHKYSGCQFRDVCSKSPSNRQVWLDRDFHKDPWNPLKNRDVDED